MESVLAHLFHPRFIWNRWPLPPASTGPIIFTSAIPFAASATPMRSITAFDRWFG